jgi:HEAT repeat protein
MTEKPKTTFAEVLTALQNTSKLFPARYLPVFSDISPEDLSELKKVWNSVPAERRTSVLRDLEELAEADTLTNFDDLARFAMTDSEPEVRVLGIRLLWECDDRSLADTFIRMMHQDPDPIVQAAAATALGSYVYEGELEELPEALLNRMADELTEVYRNSTNLQVKRHALESLGFSSREIVNDFIIEAYQSTNNDMIASALFAMGRSADNRYEKQVISKLHHPATEIQLEAVRAAGELDLKAVREDLLEMVDSGDLDEEVFYAAIWSLSQIGGNGVKAKFDEVMESEIDDDLADFMETAMDNLAFNDGLADFDLFEIDGEGAEEEE